MRILLIWPNSRNEVLGWGDLGAIAEPLALEYLAAGVRRDGHEVRILDLRLHPGDLDATLTTFAPHVVGVTAFTMHVRMANAICRRAKQLLPGCHTVVGGHHATLRPADFFEPAIDFVVQGEGVAPLRAITDTLAREGACAPGPGVWGRVDGTFVTGGPPSPPILDTLPHPDRAITGPDRDAYFIDWMRPVALLRTSVGCPYRCSFCSLWRIMDGRYLRRDIADVVAEAAAIREEFVFLVDDEAFVNGRRMLALATALAEAGVRKRYFAYCRIDTLLREGEAIGAWKAIGLERLFIGIEATSEVGLRDFNKRLTVAQVEAGLAAAAALGIEVFAQFIVRPDFGRADFKRLIRFVEHHHIKYPSFTILTPLPGTPALASCDHVLYRQPNGQPDWDLFDCQNAVVATRLPPDEFRQEYRNLHRVFNGSYLQYREHNRLLAPATATGDVGGRGADLYASGVRSVLTRG